MVFMIRTTPSEKVCLSIFEMLDSKYPGHAHCLAINYFVWIHSIVSNNSGSE